MQRAKTVVAFLLVGLACLWGQSTFADAPENGTALDRIWARLTTGEVVEDQQINAIGPESQPVGNGKNLEDVMAAAPHLDEDFGAQAADVLTGKTFWALTSNEWGPQKGARAPAPVGRSGRSECWSVEGKKISCAGTSQDGELQTGVEWPYPRFVVHENGTVSDSLTGLVWLQDASCAELTNTDGGGRGDWEAALSASAKLAAGTCGLSDGSSAGDWHLPSVNELQSLIDYGHHSPALSNSSGTEKWSQDGDAFIGVQAPNYWSSSTSSSRRKLAWQVSLYSGVVKPVEKTNANYIWPVRKAH